MDLDDQFDLEHLFLKERICRVCGEEKNLIDGFYLTRKNRGGNACPTHMSVNSVLSVGSQSQERKKK